MRSDQHRQDKLLPELVYRRKPVRLQGYDYSTAGAYFVTVCTYNREYLFGTISSNVMIVNKYGDIVIDELLQSARIRNEIELDMFVVMPNHIHVIIMHRGRGDRRSPLQRR
jgi:putative transposase